MDKLKPKKFWGQHFLKDLNVARRIAEALEAEPPQPVVEIGPGEGVMTQFLLEKHPKISVVEVDPEAVAFLTRRFGLDKLSIHHLDVLKWKPSGDQPLSIIGNLPYNISSPIFFLLLEHRTLVKEGVFMIQKEVAERMSAKEGNKIYGVLSVLLQAYFDISYEFTVPPTVFRPPPKVNSGVIRMVPKAEEPSVSFQNLRKVVKQAFGQRRKTLRNALKGIEFEEFPEWEDWKSLRAERLSVKDFIYLTSMLKQEQS
ncbi:MAG: 16S rRNA (adenine(1518)-N(6)/adenine(1519)-N(6))-dimethyltransferase RsmA [Bacteroidia bacterium]|nr:16S rRNA (adenine(1518)-N(6)/adenine(1519)-N(6))-dimethyltransferase RsmA [Bacteroidia bacterium]